MILSNGVHIILPDLVEHLFAESGDWLIYRKLYLPGIEKPLYVVAYHTKGYDEPVILLTDMVVEDRDLALQMRNRYAKRWAGCETSVEFLKSFIGLERFAVRKYKSMQKLIFLTALAMGFISYLLSRCRTIRQKVDDAFRYCRKPKGLWFYRVVIASRKGSLTGLQDAFNQRAQRGLLSWCRQPP